MVPMASGESQSIPKVRGPWDFSPGYALASAVLGPLPLARVGDAPDRAAGIVGDQKRAVGGNRKRGRAAPHFGPAVHSHKRKVGRFENDNYHIANITY